MWVQCRFLRRVSKGFGDADGRQSSVNGPSRSYCICWCCRGLRHFGGGAAQTAIQRGILTATQRSRKVGVKMRWRRRSIHGSIDLSIPLSIRSLPTSPHRQRTHWAFPFLSLPCLLCLPSHSNAVSRSHAVLPPPLQRFKAAGHRLMCMIGTLTHTHTCRWMNESWRVEG